MNDATQEEKKLLNITELSKPQRRVLGVLLEKAFTTPDQYPLTLKAITTGCNQKSNRDPVSHYSEPQVFETLEGLREIGIAAVVHSESGRSERYRHYMRHRFNFSEPQLAILTELWLRGRQTMGELRGRASRMVPIDSLDQLRAEFKGLLDQKYVQSNGSIERRGIEVDHNWYQEKEGKNLGFESSSENGPSQREIVSEEQTSVKSSSAELSTIHNSIELLQTENQVLKQQVETLTESLQQLSQQLAELRQELGS
ncbi:MAG: YceH family protein [Planctomycetes bacterium]|nr:YceH family protein [Planctomycetota bacterium]MCH9727178.1 YceH family protein [Planctomycetota bacterium]MCH9778571.1 YceH family protein [Planctomycetota bacterium]MCH9792552.1 YceH family protein [Planctomycetota bacterium]